MKSDVIVISTDGAGMDKALIQAEKVAQYKELSSKASHDIRLLAEEMMGMMRSITGGANGRFWIEDEDGVFKLHLRTETFVDFGKREKLLSVSRSGKNEAARGIMGKIRTFFDPLDSMPIFFNTTPEGMSGNQLWSMRAYQDVLMDQIRKNQAGAEEAWDELEKSVVSHIADDIKVAIRGKEVELIIIKAFEDK